MSLQTCGGSDGETCMSKQQQKQFNFPCQLGKLDELLSQGVISRERFVGGVKRFTMANAWRVDRW